MDQKKINGIILPIIVISQFCCTSLWFAGNAVMGDLITAFNADEQALGYLTSSVQLGFIIGTLTFALLTIADRFSPSKVFGFCALVGALLNFGITQLEGSLITVVALRFLTGFFLAGIYPVGMKIAADYFDKGLGKSLGYLVGALVVGTAFPHLAKGLLDINSWHPVLVVTSILAIFGGVLMFFFVPDGPFRKPGLKLNISEISGIFNQRQLRSAALGYWGHMWEIYAFWAFVPFILQFYSDNTPHTDLNIPLLSFLIIAVGGISCVIGGYLSFSFGTKRIAHVALFFSGLCCLLSPIVIGFLTPSLFIAFLLFWGIMVIADSPLFSTLVAQNAAPESKGTALTMVNCIGFSITIVSIQLLSFLQDKIDPKYLFMVLAIGPILGLLGSFHKEKLNPETVEL